LRVTLEVFVGKEQAAAASRLNSDGNLSARHVSKRLISEKKFQVAVRGIDTPGLNRPEFLDTYDGARVKRLTGLPEWEMQ